jgi:hypothetical protein
MQSDRKVSVHLMIRIQKVTINVQRSDCFLSDRQGQGDTRLTLMPFIVPNSNYVLMVNNWNCLKHICVLLYCNHQMHRDFSITLYNGIRECTTEIATYHITGHNTSIHNIISTASQLNISQNALETLPEDGNVMPKHVGEPYIINKLNE